MSGQQSPPTFDNGYASPDNTNLHYTLNSRVMVAAIIVLFIVIFFILMLHVYAKWFWHRSSTHVFVRRGIASGRSIVHPPVHTGLDAATIAQLPTFTYTYKAHTASSAENLEAGKDESAMVPLLECAVCLSEFQENEKVRMLPFCKHTFHTECIDMWFFSHSTCPLCRTVVVPATGASQVIEQHQGQEQEAMGPSHNTEYNLIGASSAVQLPCNVLFWGDEARVASTPEPSPSTPSISSSSSSALLRTRALPQITIDIPPIVEGGILLTIATPGRRPSSKSTNCHTDQEACSSQQALKSPGLRASLKRMLSRQSSRHVEGNEGSPK